MTDFLIKKFIKDKNNRESYSILSGIAGIVCNILLSISKFIVGIVTNSVSITADAANNLSDASSSIVTIAGAKIASKPVDEDHPFGHGRAEYISAMIVSFFIFIMGFELAKSSIVKIFNPEDVVFSIPSLIVLLLAIPVKLWLSYFNNKLYKITGNQNMKATMQDSLNDCFATGATIISLLVSAFTKFNIDGYIGIGVAVIIFLAGYDIIKDIISNLLGKAPDEDFVKQIEDMMLEEEYIVGVHDLIIHDYGPGKTIVSAHAEVPADKNIMEIHDVIDNVEKRISKELKIAICIHMDPIVTNDDEVSKYRNMVAEIIENYSSDFSFHDFRMVKGPSHTNLIFDLVTPKNCKEQPSEIVKNLRKAVREKDENLFIVVTVEHSYLKD
ncbi:MAG: cation-efflux pump [Escherichia coli]|nr:MAG: cation-efflux pump [Escherichia coli]